METSATLMYSYDLSSKVRVLQAMKDESLESMKQAAGAGQLGVQLRGNWLLFARLS
jgi:hypothetical protein